MDICDNADRTIQQQLQASLESMKNTEDISPLIIDGVACCIDCEEPIPPARLKALPGCCRCIECQQIHEEDE